MYSQEGEEYVAWLQHFHSHDHVFQSDQDRMGQLLLGQALGPKADLMEQAKQTLSDGGTLTWCHACPKFLLPFAIMPYPKMECVRGPLLPKARSDTCPNKYQVTQLTQNCEPLLCPLSCLEQEIRSEFRSESDTVFVHQCQIAEGKGNKGKGGKRDGNGDKEGKGKSGKRDGNGN